MTPRPGRGLGRRLAAWNGRGACVLCSHYLAEGRSRALRRHLERDHGPADFGLSPTADHDPVISDSGINSGRDRVPETGGGA